VTASDSPVEIQVPPENCVKCGGELVYVPPKDVRGFGTWEHTADAGSCFATPPDRCPECRSLAIMINMSDAWANVWDCPDCGYHHRMSLGD
jgi:Zn ribbon nucleic-acid-binding protein